MDLSAEVDGTLCLDEIACSDGTLGLGFRGSGSLDASAAVKSVRAASCNHKVFHYCAFDMTIV